MFFLHVSNRTENLLEHLAALIEANVRRSVFEQETFLIQSQGMERMISQALADRFSSWCNFRYLLPVGFLNLIAAKLDLPITPDGYEREVLSWRIEELLRTLDDAVFQPLRQYLQGDDAAVKRLQLARQLANVFDQYQLMRPDMLASWQQGQRVTTHFSEQWQMALWQRLTRQLAGAPHRGILLQQVNDILADERTDLQRPLPQRVSVFGLHILPPLFLKCLGSLARHIDVHLYILSPCRHYWGDVASKRVLLKQRLHQRGNGGVQLSGTVDEHHPLLASLGGQGRDFQKMMVDSINFELELQSYHDPWQAASPRLLHRLQSDLLAGEVTERDTDVQFERDDSVHIVSCHSKLREIGVLKDHILNFLHCDPSLELSDIVVMAPDIQEYSALIPAIFADIQHSIADRSIRGRNSVIAAFAQFVELLQGRFGWGEVLDLLGKECVYPAFDLLASDMETIHHWVRSVGIRWGLSGEHRHEMGLPGFSETSWTAGLERLLMGYAIDSDQPVAGVLPYGDIEGSGARPLGGLCRFITLFERARRQFRHSYRLTDWSRILLEYAAELFGSDDTRELHELREILGVLGANGSVFHTSAVDLAAIQSWLEYALRESRSSAGFLRGQLTFCSMLPMRSIPFRVVCLIGLNDGDFPKNDRYATFDLMGHEFRPGDRSQRADDRYQFLEALLAARDHLYISYIGQSILTNEKRPPSVVVAELLDLLRDDYDVGNRVVHHPLQPFNPKYFTGESPALFSYSGSACETARTMQAKTEPARRWWSGELEDVPAEISLQDLLIFFRNPQRWFVRECLGIRLDTERDLPPEQEPFDSAGLERYQLDQDLVQSRLQNQDSKAVYEQLIAQGRWPLGVPGELAYQAKVEEIDGFAESIRRLDLGAPCGDQDIDLEVGPYRLRGELTDIFERGLLVARYSKLKGKDLLRGWILHLVGCRILGKQCHTHIVAQDCRIHLGAHTPAQPDLTTLIEIYRAGRKQPSPLYVEPALAYARQQCSDRAKKPPLEAAQKSLEQTLEEGYCQEWSLLLADNSHDALGSEFEQLCARVMVPIWSVGNDS